MGGQRGITPALSSLASQQANPTKKTIGLCKQFLDFMATQEEAILTYHASNMVLAILSNALYLSKLKSRSCSGGRMFIAGKDEIPINNQAILNISQIIWVVMSSVVEAELGALHQCKNHRVNPTDANQTWPPAATHTNANRQCHITHTTHQQNITQGTQNHGDVFPLATVPRRPRSMLVLLKTQHSEFGRLLHKAPSSRTPQDGMIHNTHSCQQSEYRKQFATQNWPSSQICHPLGT